MNDWVDGFREQAIITFPTLRSYIDQCIDTGDIDQMLNFMTELVVTGSFH